MSSMLPAIVVTPWAAVCMLPDISRVTADCSSTAAAMAPDTSSSERIVPWMEPMASTASRAAACVAEICSRIWSVALAVCSANAFTSEATTAKPFPAMPARAASMVAFKAKRLVCAAMPWISVTTSPICAAWPLSPVTMLPVRCACSTAWAAIRAAWLTCWLISPTEADNSSAPEATHWMSLDTCPGGLGRLTGDVLDGLADRVEIGADRLLRFGATLPLVHLGRDVGRELHHLDRNPIAITDRIVCCLDPDLTPPLGDPPELARLELAPPELGPEATIGLPRALGRLHEQAVMPAANLVEPVVDRGEEVGVGRQHGAVERELDHRLRAVEGCKLALLIDRALNLCRDIGGELDDLNDATRAVEYRVIGRLDPDHAPILGDALELVGLGLALAQRVPERAIGRRMAFCRGNEVAVVLAFKLPECVADEAEEVGVGVEDRAVWGERDAGTRAVDGLEQRTERAIEQAHQQTPNQRI